MSEELMAVRADVLAQLPDIPVVISHACRMACERGDLTVGDWLGNLSDEDVYLALDHLRRSTASTEALLPWTLFAVLLANGEGMLVPMSSNLSNLVRKLHLLLQLEIAHRDGLVQLGHSTLRLETFDPAHVSMSPAAPAPAGRQSKGFKLRVVQAPPADSAAS